MLFPTLLKNIVILILAMFDDHYSDHDGNFDLFPLGLSMKAKCNTNSITLIGESGVERREDPREEKSRSPCSWIGSQ